MAVVLALRRYKPTPSLPGLMMSPRTWKLDKPCVSLTKWQRQSNSVLYRARPKQTSWQFTDLLAVLGPINFALISSVTEVSLPFSSLCQLCKWTEMKTLQFVLSLCCFSTRVLLCWTWAKSWAWWGIYGLFHASPTSENSPSFEHRWLWCGWTWDPSDHYFTDSRCLLSRCFQWPYANVSSIVILTARCVHS